MLGAVPWFGWVLGALVLLALICWRVLAIMGRDLREP
jgi:hypothetical protein